MPDRDCEKENDDPDICRQNELGPTAATMSRIVRHHLSPQLKFLQVCTAPIPEKPGN